VWVLFDQINTIDRIAGFWIDVALILILMIDWMSHRKNLHDDFTFISYPVDRVNPVENLHGLPIQFSIEP